MKKDDFKAKVERSLKRSNDIKKKKNSENKNNKTNSSNEENFKMNNAFAIIENSVFSSKTSFSKLKFLRFSWILNYAATTQLCNDIMTHRFIKNKDQDEQIVTAENSDWII